MLMASGLYFYSRQLQLTACHKPFPRHVLCACLHEPLKQMVLYLEIHACMYAYIDRYVDT